MKAVPDPPEEEAQDNEILEELFEVLDNPECEPDPWWDK